MYRIPYYLTGHTSKGFVNLLSEENLQACGRIVILQHESRTVKTAVIKSALELVQPNDYEIILSPEGADFLEGVIFNDQSLAILTDKLLESANLPCRILDKVEYVDLTNRFTQNSVENKDLQVLKDACNDAYHDLSTGLAIHDELESVYVNKMDFQKADDTAASLARKLLASVPSSERESVIKRRLFGTNTPDGVVNIVPDLLKQTARVHFIHGRAGTGKSTLMKYIANACIEKGLDLEFYHCSFDPKSIDMVRVPELDYAIFDATDPHAFNPNSSNKQHEIIDTYELFVEKGTDELFAEEINDVHDRYKAFTKKGVQHLKTAGEAIKRMEAPYLEEKKLIDIKNGAKDIASEIFAHSL